MMGDPLGQMRLTPGGIVQRDELVFQLAFQQARCPIQMVLSGGYQRQNAHVIAESIKNLIKSFGLDGGRRPQEMSDVLSAIHRNVPFI
jgi:acetoin utilization deacetylase AcuC-like enzyme